MKVGKNGQVRDLTVEDWTHLCAALAWTPARPSSASNVSVRARPTPARPRPQLPRGPLLKDAQRVTKAVARQGHLRAAASPAPQTASGADPAARAEVAQEPGEAANPVEHPGSQGTGYAARHWLCRDGCTSSSSRRCRLVWVMIVGIDATMS